MKSFTPVARLMTCVLAVIALSAGSAGAITRSNPFTIRNDHGGYVIDYAISMLKLERSRQPVQFAGRCDSACTMYLGLNQSQTCITPSVRFGFHLPFGSTTHGNRVAVSFLMKKYPRWVTDWLEANGGLSSRIKVMRYDYASKYVRSCKARTS